MSALAVIFVLTAYFPYVTYAAPAVAGCMILFVLIETDRKWAFAAYAASSALTMIMAEPEAKLIYVCFFGFYPILKSLLERLHSRSLEWILKLLTFNGAMLLIYGLLSLLVDLSVEDFGTLGKYGAWIFLGFGNIVFVLYDFALVRVANLYLYRIHPQIKKLFK